MLKKRIIPCLDCQNGRVVKGVKFQKVKDVGDPVLLGQYYAAHGADELVFYDIGASAQGEHVQAALAAKVAAHIRIPFTIGGGIRCLEDFYTVLAAGADKVSINTSAFLTPKLIEDAAKRFGSQCVVVSVDVLRRSDSFNEVFLYGGRQGTGVEVAHWLKKAVSLGAGEIVLNTIHTDGVAQGFDNRLLSQLSEQLDIPIVASGGAGSMQDFADAFTLGHADAALAASVFHHGSIQIPDLKSFLISKGIPVRQSCL